MKGGIQVKKGNIAIIVLIVIIVILITVFATMFFTGVISFNGKNSEKADSNDQSQTEKAIYSGTHTESAIKELDINEYKDLIDELILRTSFSSYSKDKTDDNNTFDGFYFYAFKGNKLTTEDLSISDKLAISYSYFNLSDENTADFLKEHTVQDKNAMYLPKNIMDKYLEKLFGKGIKYQPSEFKLIGKTVQYDESKESWIIPMGLGGRFPFKLSAVYKLVDTGEFIELYEKDIYVDYLYDSDTQVDYTILHLKNGKTEKIETQKFNNVNNWTLKDMNAYIKKGYSTDDLENRIMSNYYDDAMGYKHVFRKSVEQQDLSNPTLDTEYYFEYSEKN